MIFYYISLCPFTCSYKYILNDYDHFHEKKKDEKYQTGQCREDEETKHNVENK
jgi:hypothetical protein